ncbi:peptide cleavage/export ABC transporter [Limosilactobacillus balticus]
MKFKKYYTAQVDESDCGVAALSMVLKYYKSKIPIARLRTLAKTSKEGTSIYGIIQAAKAYKLMGKAIRLKYDEFDKVQSYLPLIVHVIKNNGLQHYYVLNRITEKHVVLSDPDNDIGIIKKSREAFFKEWTGIAILFEKSQKYIPVTIKQPNLFSYRTLLTKFHKSIFLIVICAILSMSAEIIGAFLFQGIIDNFLPQRELGILSIVSLGLIIGYFVGNLAKFINEFLTDVLGQKLTQKIIMDYLKHVFKLPISFFETRKRGEIISRFNDSNKIVEAIANIYITCSINILMVIGTLGVLFLQSSYLAFIAIMFLPIYLIVIFFFVKVFEKRNRKSMQKNSEIGSLIVDSLSGIETIKSMGWENNYIAKITQKYFELMKVNISFAKVYLLQQNLVLYVDAIYSVIILWLGSRLVINNNLLLGQLITFNALLVFLTTPLKELAQLQPKIQAACVANDRLNEILTISSEKKERDKLLEFQNSEELFVLKNVSYAYNFGRQDLNNINLRVKKSEKIVLAGPSGSGKSTLAKLLVSFRTDFIGNITYKGAPLNNFSLEKLRQEIVYVPQTPMIFSDTLLANLTCNQDVKIDRLEETCKITGVDSIIKKLPQGLYTTLDENGANLSGGQKQRICLARALLKNPEVIILDESTSSLDFKAEMEIMMQLLRLDKTFIIIAHRLQISQIVDRVVVLEKGEIVEQGTYTELKNDNSIFNKLISINYEEGIVNNE